MNIFSINGIQNIYRVFVLGSSLGSPTDGGGDGDIILLGKGGCPTGWVMTMLRLYWSRCPLTITAVGGGRYLQTSLTVISGYNIRIFESTVLYSVEITGLHIAAWRKYTCC